MRNLMKHEVTDNDRMLQIIYKLTDFNEHIKPNQMKEQIKLYGVMTEVFEDDLLPFVSKILKNIEKVIVSEGTNRLHGAISETIGNMVYFMVDKIQTEMEKRDFYENQILAFIFRIIEKSANKLVQNCGISCLSKVIINCPDDVLLDSLDLISEKMISILRTKNFQCKQPLLECLISLIFHIQEEFANHYHKFIQYLLETSRTTDAKNIQLKRVAIDALYSIGIHCKPQIAQHKEEILLILDGCRTDKNQPVRSAA